MQQRVQHFSQRGGCIASLVLMLWLAMTPFAMAEVSTDGAVMRVLPGSVPAAGYVTLYNHGHEDTALVSAHSSDFQHVELHRSHGDEHGMSHMEELDEIPISAGDSVELAPGGLHLMFMQRHTDLAVDDQVTVTLIFAQGQEKTVDFTVVPADYQ